MMKMETFTLGHGPDELVTAVGMPAFSDPKSATFDGRDIKVSVLVPEEAQAFVDELFVVYSDGATVVVHTELKKPPGFPPMDIPPPFVLETRCDSEAEAEECFVTDCDMALSSLLYGITKIFGQEPSGVYGIESYPLPAEEIMQ